MRIYQGGPAELPNPEQVLSGLVPEGASWVAVGCRTYQDVLLEVPGEQVWDVEVMHPTGDGNFRGFGFSVSEYRDPTQPIAIAWDVTNTAHQVQRIHRRDTGGRVGKVKTVRDGLWAAIELIRAAKKSA